MAYSNVAVIEDGKVKDTSAAKESDSVKNRKVENSLDKEAFLRLLVAQMQYQDPLEPTSNTEYVSQLATFSELEAMTNLNESMSITRASQLVGKKVSVETTSATTGETTYAEGTVDYVRVENGKAYLVIKDKPYPIEDLLDVMDDAYWDKYQQSIKDKESATATAIMAAISSLPEKAQDTTLEHAELVKAIRKTYNELSTEEKQQVKQEYLVRLIKAENMIAKLEAENAKNEAAAGGDKEEEGDAKGEGGSQTENSQTA